MDPHELTKERLLALASYKQASKALTRTCELADQRLAERWAPTEESDGYPTRGIRRAYWWTYPSTASDGRRVWTSDSSTLTWELLYDSEDLLLDARAGVPVLYAGMAAEAGDLVKLDSGDRQRLDEEGFSVLPVGSTRNREWEYVARFAHPDELFAGGTVDMEADTLSKWIEEIFVDLAKVLDGSAYKAAEAHLLRRGRK